MDPAISPPIGCSFDLNAHWSGFPAFLCLLAWYKHRTSFVPQNLEEDCWQILSDFYSLPNYWSKYWFQASSPLPQTQTHTKNITRLVYYDGIDFYFSRSVRLLDWFCQAQPKSQLPWAELALLLIDPVNSLKWPKIAFLHM